MTVIDLRSDTVTRPSAGMRQAMAEAEVGDDVFGDDPTVNRLQARVAELLGKPAALFVPSGTMANQIALGSQLGLGDEVICDADCHIVNYEGGALAALWGAQCHPLSAARGLLTAEQVEAAIRSPADHAPRTRLVEIENTHNRGGGSIYPLPQIDAIAAVAKKHGLALHLDGARLWNACAKTGIAPADYARHADSVSVCLSKGLGAPVGSLVAGSVELIARARRLRKRLGGGMRQVGILAAAGLYALDHNRSRLVEDHGNARALAVGLLGLETLRVDLDSVVTNVCFAELLDPRIDAPRAAAALREKGLLVADVDSRRLRFVTHLDFAAAQVPEALQRIRDVLA